MRGHPPRVTLRRPDLLASARARSDLVLMSQRATLRILGLDPGSRATGYGVLDREGSALSWVAHGVLRPRAGSLAARLSELSSGLDALIATHQPDLVSVEDVFVSASPRSALILGQARGAVLARVGAASLPMAEYAPARIKQVVAGSGRAPKAQIQRMVRRLLTLERVPPSDAADALAAAICHAHAGPLEALRRPARRRARPAASVRLDPLRARVRRAP